MARPPARFSLPQTLKVIVFSATLAGGACSSSNDPVNDARSGLAADQAGDVPGDPFLDLIQDVATDRPADVVADVPVDAPADMPDLVAKDLPPFQYCFPQADAGSGTQCPNVSFTRCSPGCTGYCFQNPDAGAGTDCGGQTSECPEGCQLSPPI